MLLREAKALIEAYIEQHLNNEWNFKFDSAKRRFGCCNYTYKRISLSKELTLLNNIDKVEDVIRHEVAHAIVGKRNGHNFIWKKICLNLGGDGKRCYDGKKVNLPKYNYVLICPNCGYKTYRHRLSRSIVNRKTACGDCCRKYNGGKFTEKFALQIKENI